MIRSLVLPPLRTVVGRSYPVAIPIVRDEAVTLRVDGVEADMERCPYEREHVTWYTPTHAGEHAWSVIVDGTTAYRGASIAQP